MRPVDVIPSRVSNFVVRPINASTLTGSAQTDGSEQTWSTPDLLNNASFETSWNGFVNNVGSDPSPASGGFSIATQTSVAYDGSVAAESTYVSNTTNNRAVQFTYQYGNRDEVFVRFYFRRTGNLPSTAHKWFRVQKNTLGGVNWFGTGWDLTGGNPGVVYSVFADSTPGNIGNSWTGIGNPSADSWHNLEWQIQEQNQRVRCWFNGSLVTQCSAGGNNSFDSVTGWLTSGGGGSSESIGRIEFDETYNSGNTNSGSFFYDKIAISTERIGTA